MWKETAGVQYLLQRRVAEDSEFPQNSIPNFSYTVKERVLEVGLPWALLCNSLLKKPLKKGKCLTIHKLHWALISQHAGAQHL